MINLFTESVKLYKMSGCTKPGSSPAKTPSAKRTQLEGFSVDANIASSISAAIAPIGSAVTKTMATLP